ncbi:MAG: M36 family metallopeptidase [Actinomycetota bacterium]
MRFPLTTPTTRRAVIAVAVAVAVASTVGPTPAGDRASAASGASYRSAVGHGLVLAQMDPTFGTIRTLARLDGALTPPSTRAPRRIARSFIREHLGDLGMTAGDLGSLAFRRDYVDLLGTHHLSWTQRARGLDAFQVGLEAAVTADGRLVAITGPIAPGLSAPTGRFRLDRDDAFAASRAAAGAPARSTPSAVDSAQRVLFPTRSGAKLAWKTRVFISPRRVDLTVVDGQSGDVLFRRNTVLGADQVGSGLAWPYSPSGTIPNGGGAQVPVTFPVADATALSGNAAHVFTDLLARFARRPRPEDEVAAIHPATLSWAVPAQIEDALPKQNCTLDFHCTWNSREPFSWRVNRRASATSTYWLLNHFHDYLEAAPIGFTEAAGNFQVVNDDGEGGLEGDPMTAHVLFGAKGRRGFPDWVNNAFIAPTPDGQAPHMATLLFRKEDYGRGTPFGPRIPSSDSGVDALVVYHEYTHGLSHRLVTYPDGEPALGSWQSAAMGEAWGDWYGLDLLDAQGYAGDGPGVDLPVGEYITGGDGIRFQFADCRVDSDPEDCPEPLRSDDAGPGGFTYGDFGRIGGRPEVHADGEIWLQTLWELRDELGHGPTVRLVTRAMEVSPPNPSFLDMRNAILLADTIVSGGANHETIWRVFAGRGMGFFAETDGGTKPTEDFSMPIDCPGLACGRVQGTIIDADAGTPVAGAVVSISGSATGIPLELSATTAADGTYTIDDVPNHRYAYVSVSGPGYLREKVRDVRVAGTAELDLALTRNWSQLDGGAVITRQIGVDDGDCPAALALDGDRATGWLTRRSDQRRPSITVRLPQAVDVDRVVLDPIPCSRYVRDAVREFTVFTRREGGTWVKAIVNDASVWKRGPLVGFRLDRGGARVVQVRLVLRGSEPGGQAVGLSEFRLLGQPA